MSRRSRYEEETSPKWGYKAAQYLFLILGIGGLGYYAYVNADTWVYQDYENWSFEQSLKGNPSSRLAYLEHFAQGRGVASPEVPPEVPPWVQAADTPVSQEPDDSPVPPQPEQPARPQNLHSSVQTTGVVGRIVIPRLRISAIVREGTDTKTLRRAVGHVPGTALPGEAGNAALAAHRDTFFRGLRDIKQGDRIRVDTVNGSYTYAVDSLKIVTPKHVEVLATSAEPILTLVTCYPFNYVGSAPKRFIVRAVLVDKPAPASQLGS